MILQRATWPRVEQYLTRSKGVLIPIGSTEQHGPGGMIGTDAICPETIAYALASREDVLVAPTLSIGMAQHHLAFPGSITLRPSTLIAVIHDVVRSLARHGFDRFLFLNGHGGNIATVTAAFSELYADRSLGLTDDAPVRCKLLNWFALPRITERVATLYGDKEGSHGTPSELSLSYYAYPEDADPVAVDPPVAPTGTIYDAMEYRRQFPDGRIGCDPTLARAEHGAELCQLAVDDVWEAWTAFNEHDS